MIIENIANSLLCSGCRLQKQSFLFRTIFVCTEKFHGCHNT